MTPTVNPMRRIILSVFLLSIGLARLTAAGVNFWSPIGPDGGSRRRGFCRSTGRPQTVYAASPYLVNGFARSPDGAEHWTLIPSDHPYRPSSLTVDPTTGVLYLTNVWVSNDLCGLARSDDNGLSRRCLLQPGSSSPVFDPISPGTLWELTLDDSFNRVLKKSTNHGESWTLIQTHGLEHAGIPLALAIDPVHPGVLYIGTQRSFSDDVLQRLWRSDDGGIHWRAWGAAMPASWDVYAGPVGPGIGSDRFATTLWSLSK